MPVRFLQSWSVSAWLASPAGDGVTRKSSRVPDWVARISIGAINAAIIAGNAPENRVHRMTDR